MRTQIGIIVAYLLLGCILLEDALPYFAESNLMEMCETKAESGEKESKKEKEVEDDLSSPSKERLPQTEERTALTVLLNGSISADSEKIPDSAHRSIFSPPPERA